MAKNHVVLTPRQKGNITRAFRKNRFAIDRALGQARRKTMRLHAKLESWVTRTTRESIGKTLDGI